MLVRSLALSVLVAAGCSSAQPAEPRAAATTAVEPRARRMPAFEAGPAEPESFLVDAAAVGQPPEDPMSPPLDIGGCLRSRMCELEGFCSPNEEGTCIAANDADCRPSDACLGGRCTARNGTCIAANDTDCRESW